LATAVLEAVIAGKVPEHRPHDHSALLMCSSCRNSPQCGQTGKPSCFTARSKSPIDPHRFQHANQRTLSDFNVRQDSSEHVAAPLLWVADARGATAVPD